MSKRVALVAGEDSGDQLGAALIEELNRRLPDCKFVGIGGRRMQAAGMDCWWSSDELSVMGLFEVLGQLRRIWGIRRALARRLGENKPDLFVGIDAPDFNLGLEKLLKRRGVRTAHYVSPTVWAWRQGRVRKIRQAADVVLCLFPFEPDFYKDHGVRAMYVGHPMADQVDAQPSSLPARRELDLAGSGPVFALLPGSRLTEVERLTAPMLGAAKLLKQLYPDARFIAALANARVAEHFRTELNALPDLHLDTFEGRVREVIAAADVVMCASGTVTLESLLINRPMVVAYRLAPLTYHFARVARLVKARNVSLPNILAGNPIVPELIQEEASPENLAREASAWLEHEERRHALAGEFDKLHQQLRCNASRAAARAIVDLLESK